MINYTQYYNITTIENPLCPNQNLALYDFIKKNPLLAYNWSATIWTWFIFGFYCSILHPLFLKLIDRSKLSEIKKTDYSKFLYSVFNICEIVMFSLSANALWIVTHI